MFLTQKNGKGTFYLVETINKKKVWRSTHTVDKAKAEMIMKEIEASRSLASKQQRQIRDLILERASAVSEALIVRKTSFSDAWNIYLSDVKTRDMKPFSIERVQSCWNALIVYMQERGWNNVELLDYDKAGEYLRWLSDERRLGAGTILLHARELSPRLISVHPKASADIPPLYHSPAVQRYSIRAPAYRLSGHSSRTEHVRC